MDGIKTPSAPHTSTDGGHPAPPWRALQHQGGLLQPGILGWVDDCCPPAFFGSHSVSLTMPQLISMGKQDGLLFVSCRKGGVKDPGVPVQHTPVHGTLARTRRGFARNKTVLLSFRYEQPT